MRNAANTYWFLPSERTKNHNRELCVGGLACEMVSMADETTSYFMLRVSDLSSDMALPRYPPPADLRNFPFLFSQKFAGVAACKYDGRLHTQASMTELAR